MQPQQQQQAAHSNCPHHKLPDTELALQVTLEVRDAYAATTTYVIALFTNMLAGACTHMRLCCEPISSGRCTGCALAAHDDMMTVCVQS
jgi:hypothetical protein